VGGEEDCPSVLGNLPQERMEAVLNERIEPGDRLVEDQGGSGGCRGSRLARPETAGASSRRT
jgi:hypothetical protein